jgi:DNA invertase Pin-like site-specific DNA recombinase
MPRKDLVSRATIEQAQLADQLRSATTHVWGYIRVSTEKQEDGQTYDVQRAGIEAYCKENKLGAPKFVHEAASAKNPAIPIAMPTSLTAPAGARPDLANSAQISPRPLLLMLVGHLFDTPGSHLIVWKLDRLARISYEQELIINLLRRKQVQIHSTMVGEQEVLRGVDDSDPARVLFRNVLGAVAQYERRMIEIRMKTGLRMKASKGAWAGGAIPFGYTVKSGDLVISPADVETVLRVFFLRDRCGETYERIAEILAKRFATKGWHKVRVSRILHNRQLYQGIYVDPFNVAHDRPDLRILPTEDGWDQWMEKNNLNPSTLEGFAYVDPPAEA